MSLGREPVCVDYKTVQITETPLDEAAGTEVSVVQHIFAARETGSTSIRITPDDREGFCEILKGGLPDTAMDSEELFKVAIKELPAAGFAEYF
jgi:hypothetical protein